jgi:hypothetical protein
MKRRKAAFAEKFKNHPKKFWKPDPEKQALENEAFIFQSEINRVEERFLKRLPNDDPKKQKDMLLQMLESSRATSTRQSQMTVNESQLE